MLESIRKTCGKNDCGGIKVPSFFHLATLKKTGYTKN